MFSAGGNLIVPPTTLSLTRTPLQRHVRIPGGGRLGRRVGRAVPNAPRPAHRPDRGVPPERRRVYRGRWV